MGLTRSFRLQGRDQLGQIDVTGDLTESLLDLQQRKRHSPRRLIRFGLKTRRTTKLVARVAK